MHRRTYISAVFVLALTHRLDPVASKLAAPNWPDRHTSWWWLAATVVLGMLPGLSEFARAQTSTPTSVAIPTVAPSPPNGATDLLAYQAARLPLSVNLSVGTVSLARFLNPNLLAGTYDSGSLPSPAGLGPAPVSVAVLYDYAQHAGKTVFVQPLNGGSINGQPGAQRFTVNPDGLVAFSFQPPARPGRYPLALRLDNVEAGLRFLVFDPAAGVPGTP